MRRVIIILFILISNLNLLLADNRPKVDIVFVVDTSTSMDDEAKALFGSIDSVISNLSDVLDIKANLLGITETRWELESSVKETIPDSSVDSIEDWGTAVYDIASKYRDWRDGAVKIVIPISDECPKEGDDCDGEDEEIIKLAKEVAEQNGVEILPIIGGSPQHIDLYSKIKQLASSLSTVNGKIVVTSSDIFADEMGRLIEDIIASVTKKIVRKPKFDTPIFIGKYIKVPIIKASGANMLEWQIFEDNRLINTKRSTQLDRVSIYVLDNRSHNYILKARSIGFDINGDKIYSDYSTISIKYIGDIKRVIEECQVDSTLLECQTQKDRIKEESFDGNRLLLDSIEPFSGNFIYSHTDIKIKTAGVLLRVIRYYNTLDIKRGWGFNIIARMDTNDINHIKIHWGDGAVETFIKSENGWSSKYGTNILYTKSNFYIVETADGIEYKFMLDGKLFGVIDRRGFGYFYEYLKDSNSILIRDNFNNLLLKIRRDDKNRVVSISDIDGELANYDYNERGDIISYRDGEGGVTNYQYNLDNILYRVENPNGVMAFENSYDEKGRIFKHRVGNSFFQVNYNSLDNNTYLIPETVVIYPSGVIKRYINFYTRVVLISCGGLSTRYDYDINGKLSKFINQEGEIWEYRRDSRGRVLKEIDPLNHQYSFSYDESGNLIEVRSPLGLEKRLFYDESNNLIKIEYPDNSIELFKYNRDNQLIEFKNRFGYSTIYNYSSYGRLESIKRDDEVIYIYYDGVGNIKRLLFGDNDFIEYSYNRLYKPISIRDNSKEVLYWYDSMQRVIKRRDVFGSEMSYGYNEFGKVSFIVYPDGKRVEYIYNLDGNLSRVVDFKGNITEYKYNNFGNISKIIYPNGFYTKYEYDKTQKIIKLQNINSKNRIFSANSLVRNALGDVIEFERVSPIKPTLNYINSFKFAKDEFEYNSNGDLLKYGDIGFKYDLRGKLISILDLEDRLEYKYDPEGERIEVFRGGKIKRFLVDRVLGDRDKPLAQIKDGYIQKYYIYDSSGNLLYFLDNKNFFGLYQYNYLGDVVALSNSKGELLNSYIYSISGELLEEREKIENIFKYRGRYGAVSDSSNLIYLNGKYYSLELKRWIESIDSSIKIQFYK